MRNYIINDSVFEFEICVCFVWCEFNVNIIVLIMIIRLMREFILNLCR